VPQPFQPFGIQHLLAVISGAVIITVLILLGRKGGISRQIATGTLAFFCLAAYPLGQAAWFSLDADKSLDNLIPFHLCDIAAITGGFALLFRKPLLASLTYFWGLAATIQGLLTPAITVGFPHWPFVMFFVHHFVIVGTALYLPIVEGWRPKQPFWKSPLEVYVWSLGYLAFAMVVNRILGTNFGFASHRPPNPSLIDYLGPWPWYLVSMSVIALILYLLLALPFAGSRRTGK
jgi:hypothetical integral membrane protein (TIGR02206 family)